MCTGQSLGIIHTLSFAQVIIAVVYRQLYAIRQHTGCKRMVQLLPPEDKQSQHPLGMARIINAKEVLQIYAAAFPEDEMQLELSDKQLSVNNGFLYLWFTMGNQ